MSKIDRSVTGVPSAFLDKLNDAGVYLQSTVVGEEKQYLLTRKELEFDETKKIITIDYLIGIGVAFPLSTPISEVARVLTHAIPKMVKSKFDDNKSFSMFTYVGSKDV